MYLCCVERWWLMWVRQPPVPGKNYYTQIPPTGVKCRTSTACTIHTRPLQLLSSPSSIIYSLYDPLHLSCIAGSIIQPRRDHLRRSGDIWHKRESSAQCSTTEDLSMAPGNPIECTNTYSDWCIRKTVGLESNWYIEVGEVISEGGGRNFGKYYFEMVNHWGIKYRYCAFKGI